MDRQHEQFKVAKQIALSLHPGELRRARFEGRVTNYTGLKTPDGRSWVLGDSSADLQNARVTINGQPAREVFEGFTIMEG